jgi:hypothetical protein
MKTDAGMEDGYLEYKHLENLFSLRLGREI